MNLKVTLFVILSLSSASLAQTASNKAKRTDSPTQFITQFYKRYLNANTAEQNSDKQPASKPFFSKSLKSLLARNYEVCSTKSRGDDICGFGSDGDIYLDTQESSPDLNFSNSEFKALQTGPKTVEATFTVWPEERDDFQKKLRFTVITENGQWVVDDIEYTSTSDAPRLTMRQQVEKENEAVTAEAKDLHASWIWFVQYLEGDPDQGKPAVDKISRFISYPLDICDQKGACAPAKQDDTIVGETFAQLRDRYFPSDKTPTRPENSLNDPEFGKKESAAPKDMDTATKGPFVFTYKNSMWWLTQIDLRKLT
jgi:hypothetical protein